MNARNLIFSRKLASLAAVGIVGAAAAFAQSGTSGGQWPAYGGDKANTKYSPLDQITRDNAKDLKVAWTWSSPDNDLGKTNPALMAFLHEVTPIFVDGVLYAATSLSQVAAIDAATGKSLWVFDTESYKAGRPTNLGFVHRGVAYWADGDDKRIFIGTGDSKLWAINATTGKPIETFGTGGWVSLLDNLRRKANPKVYSHSSPPIVCRDVVAVGSSILDGPVRKEMPPGDVQGFDVRTGKPAWTFHNPPAPGEPGYDTWKEGSADYTGNGNVWTTMSADDELGYMYLPFGTPTNDWYGGHRKGQGLFAESLVCIEAATGKLVWYFQTTHHGVWDYDLCAAPALLDVTVDGKPRKICAQVTKEGFLFVLDRITGEPIWPIEERPVPQSTAEGEETWPTQPFPTKPAPYETQGSTEDMLIDFTPALKAEALKILDTYNHGPLYTPPMEGKPTINNPGWGGGGNWMGCGVDVETGMVYVPSQTGPISVTLTRPNKDVSNFTFQGQMNGGVEGPQGLPLFKPPYGRITAYDLNTGDTAWQIAHGNGPRNHPALKDLNLPALGTSSRGYPLVTKTLLFAAMGSMGGRGSQGGGEEKEANFRAIDKKTGEVLAEVEVPGAINGTPMTYLHGGKQYIVIATGGMRSPQEMVALALP